MLLLLINIKNKENLILMILSSLHPSVQRSPKTRSLKTEIYPLYVHEDSKNRQKWRFWYLLVSVHTETIATNLDWDHHKVAFSIVLNRLRVDRKAWKLSDSMFLESHVQD